MDTDCSNIDVSHLDPSYLVDKKAISEIAHSILTLLNLENQELSIRFVTPQEIKEINAQYRQKDAVTDVLAFPQLEWKYPVSYQDKSIDEKLLTPLKQAQFTPLGDIIICLDKAHESAKDIGQSLSQEVCFLLVHGILHLCGHDHKNPQDEAIMLAEQRVIMNHLVPDSLQDQTQWRWYECVKRKDEH